VKIINPQGKRLTVAQNKTNNINNVDRWNSNGRGGGKKRPLLPVQKNKISSYFNSEDCARKSFVITTEK